MKVKILSCIAIVMALQSCKKSETKTQEEVNSTSTKGKIETMDASTITTGFYKLTCAASSKVMEVGSSSYKDNALIQQWQNFDFQNQKWKVVNLGDGYYKIINVASGKALTVPGFSTQTGVQLEQYHYFGGTSQQWSIDYLGYGNCKITNRGNGLAITDHGASSNNGNLITQETYAANSSQYWSFAAIGAQSYKDDDVIGFFNRTTGSVAFDEGTSVPLSDGRVLWVTQDAWYQGSLTSNGRLNGNHFISYSNSIIIQPSLTNWASSAPMMTNTSAYLNIGNILPKQAGKDWTWPGPGVEVGNDVYIQAGEGNGLSSNNQALYKLTKSTGNAWNTITRTMPAEMSGQNTIGYSLGMVKAADGYVYCFGDSKTGYGYSSNIYVARFHTSNPQSWTFWDGFVWKTTRSSSATLTTGLAANSVGYVNGKYVLCTISSGWSCDSDGGMYVSYSSSPTGPWSARTKIYTINEPFKSGKARYYTPSVHSESSQNNELLITYCLNFACDDTVDPKESDGNLDPYFYRVKAIRVPFSLIGL